MKKVILVLGLVALIATAPQAAMRYGVESISVMIGNTLNTYGLPYVGFQLNENQTVDIGATYRSLSDGDTTILGIIGRLENKITEIGKIKLSWAGVLGIISVNAAANSTTLVLAGSVGAEYKISDAFGIYGNVDILNYQSVSGDITRTDLFILNGSGNAYTGMRIYI